MNQKRAWSTTALFIIALMISMPFYAADVYAVSISITKNQGSNGVDGFIDGDGDTWEVEATIVDDDNTVQPENVKIKIGSNEDTFNSCSASTNSSIGSSASTCKYLSSLKDGVTSGAYDFSVFYYYPSGLGGNKTVSDSGTIKVDGTSLDDGSTDALTINFKSVKQDSKGLVLDFSVADQPTAYCSGLSKIEIIETTAGVLETIDGFAAGDCDYDYKADKLSNVLSVNLSGESKRYLKIKAVDQLGHKKTSKAISFYADYVAPKVDTSSLELSSFGKFIGAYEKTTDITVNVTEKKGLDKVTAVSSDADLSGDIASCDEDSKTLGLWVCTWKSVKVQPKSSISITVTAVDSAGNKGTGTLVKTLTQDSSVPVADFFGTVRTFEKVSYVSYASNVVNRIVLKVSESGAGIDKKGILANLAGLKGKDAWEPEYFNESTYEAGWDVDYSGGADEILASLYKFQDKVGNLGTLPSVNVQIDNTVPKVEEVEIYGSSDSVTDKDYFQSNDKLSISFKIKELTGLMILVDLNDVVKDAKNSYPDGKVKDIYPEAGKKDYSGWMVFTEDDCTKGKTGDDSVSSNWECKLETPSIKSGPDSSAELNIEVRDTAGNLADWVGEPVNINSGSKGVYKIEILGLDLEQNPDYWESSGVSYAPSFIDLETTELIRTRMSATVSLRSEDAEARLIELSGCIAAKQGSNASVSLTRSLLYGGMGGTDGSASPTIVLEFDAFDGVSAFGSELEAAKEKGVFDTASVPVVCKLKIYSEIGRKVTKAAEIQEVNLSVPFAYSELGALDENIDEMIEDIKDTAAFKIPNALKEVNMVLQWVKHIAGILVTLTNIMTIYNTITASTESLRNTVVASYMAPLICKSNAAAQKIIYKLPEYVQIPVQIFACQPLTHQVTGKDGKVRTEAYTWYGRWQELVLNGYNIASGRLVTVPATSLYENFYTSVAGLCVPGILYNLEKLRQVQCRYISCLKNEVPAGIATMDSCKKMHEYLTCRHWAGPVFKLTPLAAIDIVLNYFKSWYASLGAVTEGNPLPLIRVAAQVVCMLSCIGSNTGSAACTYIGLIVKGLDILDSLYGAFTAYPSVTGDPYCGALDLGAFD